MELTHLNRMYVELPLSSWRMDIGTWKKLHLFIPTFLSDYRIPSAFVVPLLYHWVMYHVHHDWLLKNRSLGPLICIFILDMYYDYWYVLLNVSWYWCVVLKLECGFINRNFVFDFEATPSSVQSFLLFCTQGSLLIGMGDRVGVGDRNCVRQIPYSLQYLCSFSLTLQCLHQHIKMWANMEEYSICAFSSLSFS